MDFNHLKRVGPGDGAGVPAHLHNLLQISRYWQKLDKEVGRILPANLRPYVRTACIEGDVLVLLAANSMAASRLKMLLPALQPSLVAVHEGLSSVRVRLVPQTPEAERVNRLELSETAVANFEQTAECLAERHPKLAQALARLAQKHRKP
ncbi:DciA family protein [Neisseria animalis]|uniref:DUF721 domain-containing protein n=2 Tax=Neisseria animalis TaxID=492 RepID=A0A5P3MU09_NEIAN|nr:DciA family protein [Neisseria animalis]QEY25018.1 DUF721 domain-containing protein [Neisseria animalis]ROW32343.1 DUF721 domain-containing protein [Neisseria animalis]VEE06617.1 Protein of uncharacterised function (DUF721) [Neisseria animalis]